MSDDDLLQKLTWFYILIPGFVSVSVAGAIVEFAELSELQFVCYCLLASTMAGLLAWPISRGLWLGRILSAPAMHPAMQNYLFFGLAMTFAVLIGATAGLAAQNDFILRTIRTIPGGFALDKTSHKRPLVLLMGHINKSNTQDGGIAKMGSDGRPINKRKERAYVRIQLKDGGGIYEGRPHYFAHGEDASELYLSPACKGDSAAQVEVLGSGILIMESSINYIELVDYEFSTCRKIFFPPEKKNTPSTGS